MKLIPLHYMFFGGRCKNCPLLQNSHRGSRCPEIKKFALRFFYCAVCLWESQYTNLQYFYLGYTSQDIHAINGGVFYMLVSIQDSGVTTATPRPYILTWHLLQPPEPWFYVSPSLHPRCSSLGKFLPKFRSVGTGLNTPENVHLQ